MKTTRRNLFGLTIAAALAALVGKGAGPKRIYLPSSGVAPVIPEYAEGWGAEVVHPYETSYWLQSSNATLTTAVCDTYSGRLQG